MRCLVLLACVAVPALAQPLPAPGDPCIDALPEGGGVVGETVLPDCFAPPRPESAAVFVPFPEGARWDFVVERQRFHVSEPGVSFDTLGTESWRVAGAVAHAGREVPLLHVVRADAAGDVTDRAECAVVTDIEALSQAYWDRWELAVHDEFTATVELDGPPPDSGHAMSALTGPQELVTLRFEPLAGRCPDLDAWITADPMAGALSPLLVGADVYAASSLGMAQTVPEERPGRFESGLWLFAGGVGPYLRAVHTETAEGQVEDRFHRLVHASVGDVVLGRPLDVTGAVVQAAVPDPLAEVAIVGAGPNPFRDRLTLRFTVPAPGPVVVEVYDALGRRISRAELGDRPAGAVEHVVSGDGLASGVYILRAESGGTAAVHRVTRVR